ncbi:MAG: anti-sigma factor [Ignavibacteriaceae bacterium]
MADKSECYEFLYAYTLGCLDEEDLINLKQYLSSSDDYYWQELGDFQNLSALLPSILSMENPAPEVKDRVARKLYRIRNEIKAKRDKLKNEKVVPDVSDEEEIEAETEKISEPVREKTVEKEPEEIVDEKPEQSVEDFEVVSAVQKPAEILATEEPEKEDVIKENEQTSGGQILNFNSGSETVTDDEIDTTSEEVEGPSIKSLEESGTKNVSEERIKLRQKHSGKVREEKKKSSVPFIITSLLMFIFAIVFVFMYFKVSSNVKGYESQIVSLNEQLGNLKEQFRQNKDLQAVLNSKNLRTVNLTGSDIATNAIGKLFISMDTNHGILQLSNLPQLHGNGTYQLWIYIYDNYMSLCKFSPTDNSAYIPFDTPQLSVDSNVSFLVTEEPPNGSLRPGNKIYLKGSF